MQNPRRDFWSLKSHFFWQKTSLGSPYNHVQHDCFSFFYSLKTETRFAFSSILWEASIEEISKVADPVHSRYKSRSSGVMSFIFCILYETRSEQSYSQLLASYNLSHSMLPLDAGWQVHVHFHSGWGEYWDIWSFVLS